jgi:uncharacterized protein
MITRWRGCASLECVPGGEGRTDIGAPGVNRPVDISAREARRIALAAQGFADRRPTGRIDRRHFRKVLDRLATVQVDSVNVLTRSHELVFFARLGPYDRTALSRWLWSSREVFEYWGHEASLHPVERHPLFRWRMAEEHPWVGVRQAAAGNPDLADELLAEVRARGPLAVSEMETEDRSLLDVSTDVAGGSWWGWGAVKRVMAHLFLSGDVTAVRRSNFERVYLVPDRWLPPEVLRAPDPDEEEAHRGLVRIAARALGLGTARDLADYYRLRMSTVKPVLEALVADGELLPARVEGWRQPVYLHPEAHRPRRRLRARALLSPFDSLIWERQRTERLWDFRYRLEIYTPAAKRVHGYYVLPFLLGDELVGRVDLKADRKADVLRVQAAWSETAGTGPDGDHEVVATELAASLSEMAAWLGLSGGVDVRPRGDLAPVLRQALPC